MKEQMIEVRDDFLDRAILALATRGPVERWDAATLKLEQVEDRDAWAARVVDDALALAARRELKLLEIEAGELLARREAPGTLPDDPDFYVDCPKCELLRKDVDRWVATSQAQAVEEHKLRAELKRLWEVIEALRSRSGE